MILFCSSNNCTHAWDFSKISSDTYKLKLGRLKFLRMRTAKNIRLVSLQMGNFIAFHSKSTRFEQKLEVRLLLETNEKQ
jgi:hypothetical protein